MNIAAAEVYRKGHIRYWSKCITFFSDNLPDKPRRDVINKISFAIIERCDAILVIGSSQGADFERDLIMNKGLPVYYSIEEIPQNNEP